MILHKDHKAFSNAILAAGEHYRIPQIFIEKDYWITLVLKRLGNSEYAESVVFKGGTSLSKGYKLIDRFSEDIDLAIRKPDDQSSNKLKQLIRNIEKSITVDLDEIDDPNITSKGSRYRKSIFSYNTDKNFKSKDTVSSTLIIEINSFANANPYVTISIQSIIAEFLTSTDNKDLVSKYNLEPFSLFVLDKKRTLLEKLVSLIRFSYDEDLIDVLKSKIRHFYDLHYLSQDRECRSFITGSNFCKEFQEVLNNDRSNFGEPPGWSQKKLHQSPIILKFDEIWPSLVLVYERELGALAFAAIPRQEDVFQSFKILVDYLKQIQE